jgi:hypothetical protein
MFHVNEDFLMLNVTQDVAEGDLLLQRHRGGSFVSGMGCGDDRSLVFEIARERLPLVFLRIFDHELWLSKIEVRWESLVVIFRPPL